MTATKQLKCLQSLRDIECTNSESLRHGLPLIRSRLKLKCDHSFGELVMARGQQKIQSQQKAAKRAQDAKRAEGADQRKAAQAALVHQCVVCKSQMPDPKTYKQHFVNKHPKATLPEDLKDVVA